MRKNDVEKQNRKDKNKHTRKKKVAGEGGDNQEKRGGVSVDSAIGTPHNVTGTTCRPSSSWPCRSSGAPTG